MHLILNKADLKPSLVYVFVINHPPQVVYVGPLVSYPNLGHYTFNQMELTCKMPLSSLPLKQIGGRRA